MYKHENAFFIGRGIDYGLCEEGSLKLKEISYINATGYTAGELKHGPIAMLDESMPVLSILMSGKVYEKILSNSEEAKARNARMIALTDSTDKKLDDLLKDLGKEDKLSKVKLYKPRKLLQVVGHTPMAQIERNGNLISCDVFSTHSDGSPFGTQEFLLLDTVTWEWQGIKI